MYYGYLVPRDRPPESRFLFVDAHAEKHSAIGSIVRKLRTTLARQPVTRKAPPSTGPR